MKSIVSADGVERLRAAFPRPGGRRASALAQCEIWRVRHLCRMPGDSVSPLILGMGRPEAYEHVSAQAWGCGRGGGVRS